MSCGRVSLDAFDCIDNVMEARRIVHERSETTGVRKDPVTQVAAETAFADDVDPDPKQIRHVLLESDEVEQAASRLHPDEEVEVAVRARIAACIRAEYTHIDGAMTVQQLDKHAGAIRRLGARDAPPSRRPCGRP